MELPQTMSAEDVRKIVQENNVSFVPSHDCSICGVWVGTVVSGESLYFRSACGCSDFCGGHPSDWQELADSYNMQSNDKARSSVLNNFKGVRE